MGIGLISISTSQKKEKSGAPFTPGSAFNGTSVDTATGKIVLGNDVADPAAPAALVNDREILMDDALFNQFRIILNALQSAGVRTLLRGDLIQVDPEDFGAAQVLVGGSHLGTSADVTVLTNDFGESTINARNSVDGNATIKATVNQAIGGTSSLQLQTGVNDRLSIQATGNGLISFRVGQFFLQTMAFNCNTLCTLVQSDTGAAFNGATLQVSGTHTFRRFDQSQNGALTLDRDLDSGKVIRNSGALTVDFPNFIGANFRVGFFIDILVTNAAGITVNAGAGRKIFFGDLATSINGTLSATNVGACVRIYVVDPTNFYANFYIGAWSLT